MSNLQRRITAVYGIECYLRNKGFKVTKKFVSETTANFCIDFIKFLFYL